VTAAVTAGRRGTGDEALRWRPAATVLAAGAVADAFGVGTQMGTSADAPYINGVYKIVEDESGLKVKLSTGKVTLPGRKQVYRFYDGQGVMQRDLIALEEEPPPKGAEPLLVEVIRDGELVYDLPAIKAIRARAEEQIRCLPERLRAIEVGPEATYAVEVSSRLAALRDEIVARAREVEEQT